MKSFLSTLSLGIALCAMAHPALADETTKADTPDIAKVEGLYAGTFFCGFGEMGMTLSLKDAGEFTQKDFAGDPCRSATGTCNEQQVLEHKGKRKAKGVLNFFPTVTNPEAPQGAFHVSGFVEYAYDFFNEMEFEPGEWIAQPENFGASAMTGVLVDGTISGKPTAPGCHTLNMVKIHSGD